MKASLPFRLFAALFKPTEPAPDYLAHFVAIAAGIAAGYTYNELQILAIRLDTLRIRLDTQEKGLPSRVREALAGQASMVSAFSRRLSEFGAQLDQMRAAQTGDSSTIARELEEIRKHIRQSATNYADLLISVADLQRAHKATARRLTPAELRSDTAIPLEPDEARHTKTLGAWLEELRAASQSHHLNLDTLERMEALEWATTQGPRILIEREQCAGIAIKHSAPGVAKEIRERSFPTRAEPPWPAHGRTR